MATPQMYRPPPRWQVWASLGGALAIMTAAVVLAGIHPEPPPATDISQIPEAVSAVLELEPAPPEPTPPPEEPDIPPPPPPEAVPEFREEQPTPPPQPRPKTSRPPAPIRRETSGATGPVSMSSARAQARFSPKPEYPYEARRQKKTGSGVCVLTIDTSSGSVTDADMAQSTGSPILDNATTSAFKRWRFQPGTAYSKVRVPITFTLTGASF